MSFMSRLAKDLGRLPHIARGAMLHRKYRDFTILSKWSYIKNLLLVRQAKTVPGCVAECGVWRGGMIAGISEILGDRRTYYLFDSFEGLPPAGASDGAAALAWQKDVKAVNYDNCRASMDEAQRAMRMAGATRFELIKGWFADTMPHWRPDEPIAVLRLDGDWFESTYTCLSHLMPRMAPGGLVVIDDFYHWEGCAKAVYQYLADHQSKLRIRQWFDEVCYLRVE